MAALHDFCVSESYMGQCESHQDGMCQNDFCASESYISNVGLATHE